MHKGRDRETIGGTVKCTRGDGKCIGGEEKRTKLKDVTDVR